MKEIILDGILLFPFRTDIDYLENSVYQFTLDLQLGYATHSLKASQYIELKSHGRLVEVKP